MTKYDFSLLNPAEFQDLANDIIELEIGSRVERFKDGKDGGIDGRIFINESKTNCIIQSKHFYNSKFSNLMSQLKREYDKVNRLSPDRYILVTSIPLNPAEKSEIYKLFNPYIKNESDIWGRNDIDKFIEGHDFLEKKYYKLWIRSSSILMHHLNKDIFDASAQKIRDMYNSAKFYAKTSVHDKAYEKLINNHVVIVTGNAGVGKTTLAEQLCLSSICDGYEFVLINKDVSEGFKVSNSEIKQVFYFDDFLGTNYLDAIEKNECSQIVLFINYVCDSNKRFVLTSRANIIDKAYEISSLFSSSIARKKEYTIHVNNYTYNDKCLILYNMILRSDISKKMFVAFLDKNFIARVIFHKNFNPRIIETILNINNLSSNDYENNIDSYKEFILENLNNPYSVWDNVFSYQIDESARIIVMLVVLSGGEIGEERLIKAYNYYIEHYYKVSNSHISIDFFTVIKSLFRTFITKNIYDNKRFTYSPFNPSVTDYIVNKLIYQEDIWANLERSINSVDSIDFLIRSHENNKNYITQVVDNILLNQRGDLLNESATYIAKLGIYASENIFKKIFPKDYYSRYISLITEYHGQIYFTKDIILFFDRLISIYPDTDIDKEKKFYEQILKSPLDFDELIELSQLLFKRGIDDILLKSYFKNCILDNIEDEIKFFASENFYKYITENANLSKDSQYNLNVNYDELYDDLEKHFNKLYCPLLKSDFIEYVNKDELEEMYLDALKEEEAIYENDNKNSTIDIISMLENLYNIKYEC